MRRRTSPQQVVVMSLVALVFAGALLFLMVRFASRNPDATNLGAEVIRLQAERTADRIGKEGPYFLEDPYEGRGRDVYLQHVGADPEAGWLLILARPSEGGCLVTWDNRRTRFEAPCTGRTYPADGSGLTTYPAPVENGRVVIDLRGG